MSKLFGPIRMARNVADYAGAFTKNMPILMRGFVRVVNRPETMTDAGPRRTVAIEGADYGYILDAMPRHLPPLST